MNIHQFFLLLESEVAVRRFSLRKIRSHNTRSQIDNSPRKTRSQIDNSPRKTRSQIVNSFKTQSKMEENTKEVLFSPRKTRSAIASHTSSVYIRLSRDQKKQLEEIFQKNRYPDAYQKEKIAEEFDVDYERVKRNFIWLLFLLLQKKILLKYPRYLISLNKERFLPFLEKSVRKQTCKHRWKSCVVLRIFIQDSLFSSQGELLSMRVLRRRS